MMHSKGSVFSHYLACLKYLKHTVKNYAYVCECVSPDGSIAHSHNMTGDASSCLDLQGVFLK